MDEEPKIYRTGERKISTNSNSSIKLSINKNQFKPLIGNIDELSESKISLKKKFFFLKKINLKNKYNSYYSKAVNNIFSDVNRFLEHKYEGKKVIIGKGCTEKGLKELSDIFHQKYKRKRTLRKNEGKSFISHNNKTLRNKTSNNNLFDISVISTDTVKQNLKRKEFIKEYPISDYELKKIYQEVKEREKSNRSKKKEFSFYSIESDKPNKISDNNLKQKSNTPTTKNSFEYTEKKKINHMINLQENILKNRILKNKKRLLLSKKIMNRTFKKDSNILMNNKSRLIVIKKQKMDKDINEFGVSKDFFYIKHWLSDLRTNSYYETNKPQKEIIYYNRNMNSPFDKTTISNMSDNNNSKDINKNKFIVGKNCFNKKKFYLNINIKKMNFEQKKDYETLNAIRNLNKLHINGKNLLSQEIKISKELFGKKKKFINYSFGKEEVSDILFAKNKSLGTINTPKAIKNAFELHD